MSNKGPVAEGGGEATDRHYGADGRAFTSADTEERADSALVTVHRVGPVHFLAVHCRKQTKPHTQVRARPSSLQTSR